MRTLIRLIATLVPLSALAATGNQQDRQKLDQIQQALKDDVPRVLCVDQGFATGGQPTDAAFSKLAANGFRAVLNLRTANEGIDLDAEREMVEKNGMRYVNIPIVSSAPRSEQVDEFIKAVKDKSNQPMLIHCGSANRVGAMWMIYRVIEQGWPEDKALEEATRIGLTSEALKKFAADYIASHKSPPKASTN
ncbi:MAG TPA: protein tyrosine phosphatase family protein [Blastocatellia bacterium]|nr:protein tyrosine phosphatase family protein [Blastocatellia bacterium]